MKMRKWFLPVLVMISVPANAAELVKPQLMRTTRRPNAYTVHADQSQAITPDERSISEYRPRAVSVELGGRAGLYSICYDAMVGGSFALGAGFSTFAMTSGQTRVSAWIFPLYAHYYFSDGLYRPYLSGGATVAMVGASSADTDSLDSNLFATGIAKNVGLGFEIRGREGTLFRLSGYAFFNRGKIYPWAGLSFGGALR